MQKKHFFLLCFLLLLLSACQSSKKSTHQEAHTVAHPVKVAGEEVYYPEKPTNDVSSGSPTQKIPKQKKLGNAVLADSDEEFLDDREIKLTPESELYFFHIQEDDYKNGTLKKYQDPLCVEAITREEENLRINDTPACFTSSEIHLLVRIKEQIKYPYCHRGKFHKYNNHYLLRADVLYSFSKDFNENTIEMVYPIRNRYIPETDQEKIILSEGEEIRLVGVDKNKYNEYSLNFSELLQLQPRPLKKGRRAHLHPLLKTCTTINLPTKIKDLETYFINLPKGKPQLGPTCYEKRYAPERKKAAEIIYQTHGTPGKKCSIAEEERKAEEAYLKFEREQAKYDEAFNVGGKKIPCADCPSGYMIQDLSIEEYTEKVNKNLDKLEKEQK